MTGVVSPWRMLSLLVCVQILNAMDRQVIFGLLEPIRHEFSLSDTELGLLSGLAYSGAALIVAVPAGALADKFSRKTILTAALGIWSAFTALCGASAGFLALLIGRMGVGAAESAAPPASLSMIADAFPQQRQAGATGIFYASGAIGGLLASAVGGWIALHYGWRYAFFLAGVPALILIPIVIKFLKEPPRIGVAKEKHAPVREVIAAIRTDRNLALVILALSFSSMAPIGFMSWATSLMIRNHGLDIAQAGAIFGFVTAIFVPAGHFLGGQFGDRLAVWRPGSQLWFISAAVVGGGALGIVSALSPILTVTVVAMCASSFVAMLYLAPGFAMVMQIAPPGPRATVFAIVTVLGNLAGTGLGPVIVGNLSDMIGGPRSLAPAISLVMLVTLIPGALFALLARRLSAWPASLRKTGI